jgi:hypothetical protein
MARRRSVRRTATEIIGLRFENASDSVYNMIDSMVTTYFTDLTNAKIKALFDMKKRKAGGQLVLGRLQKSNDLIRRLTVEEARGEEGYDYVMYIDKKAWDLMAEIDRQRLIRHELNHADVDPEKKNPYGMKDHDVKDFAEEIRRNQDDINWASRVATLVENVYDQERENRSEE